MSVLRKPVETVLTLCLVLVALSMASCTKEPVTFSETGIFTDARDSHHYPWVQIGDQVWMAANLSYLPSVSPSSSRSDSIALYYVYDNQSTDLLTVNALSNYITYGVLYNWEAAKTACPSGWHLPSDEEWKVLEKTLGMTDSDVNDWDWRKSGVVGDQLKETGTSHWQDLNEAASNSSGLTVIPGGWLKSQSEFVNLGLSARFWSSTDYGESLAWFRGLFYDYNGVQRYGDYRRSGLSVRCIRD